ncbi:MAG TPA: hypothetical protein VHN38_12565, partial [Immundisolibacter sp.]|nr:hypothetical protein [Immundisolibacter sp.]
HVLTQQDVIAPGLQPQTFAGARIFVSPNPSPANARYNLAQLIDSYRQLAACIAGNDDGTGRKLSGVVSA